MKPLLLLWACCCLGAFDRRPLTWVAIGDSITYLNDHCDETGNRVTKGYLTDVVERWPDVRYVNQGHNGWTTTDFARAIDRLGIPVGDVYTIFLGTNDWWQGHRIGAWRDYEQATGDGTIYGCLRIIIDKLHRLNAGAPIVLITPMPRTDFVYVNDPRNNAYGCYREKNGQSLEAVAAAVVDIGRREGCRVIDLYHEPGLGIAHLVRYKRLKDPQTGVYRRYIYPAYCSVPFDPASDEYPYPADAMDMTYDGLHPSDKGNALIAEKVSRVFKGL